MSSPIGPGSRRGGPAYRRAARRVQRPRSRRRAALLGLSLLLALAVVVVLNSPAFRVSSIVVEGHGYLSREDVLSAAGVRTGDRMITFRPAAARSSLLKLPHVAAAEVRRVWPRGVRIVLRERTGLALLPCGTGWVEVASDGVAIQLHVALEATGLPVLEGVDATLVGVGERVPGVNARTALEALAIAAARSEPARRAVLATTGLELELMDGTWLYLGAAGSVVETRISAALAILEELRARGQRAAYIDVRVPGQPVIRPR